MFRTGVDQKNSTTTSHESLFKSVDIEDNEGDDVAVVVVANVVAVAVFFNLHFTSIFLFASITCKNFRSKNELK